MFISVTNGLGTGINSLTGTLYLTPTTKHLFLCYFPRLCTRTHPMLPKRQFYLDQSPPRCKHYIPPYIPPQEKVSKLETPVFNEHRGGMLLKTRLYSKA